MISGISTTTFYTQQITSTPAPGRTSDSYGSAPAPSADSIDISPEAKARAIMADYNLHHMSYNDMHAMADALRDAGTIDDEQWLHMKFVPDFSRLGHGEPVDMNAPRNFVEDYAQRVESARHFGAPPEQIAYKERMLNLLYELDSMRA